MSIYHFQNPTTLLFDYTFLDDDFSSISADHMVGGRRYREWPTRLALFFGIPFHPYRSQRFLIFVLQLLLMPFIFLRNVLKLPTIFLPLWIVKHLDRIRSMFDREFHDPNQQPIIRVLAGLGEAVAILLILPFYLTGTISRFLLQPLKSVRHLYNSGHPYWAVLAGIAIAITYMAIFPFVIYVLGPIVVAKAATVLPGAIMHAVHAVTSAIEAIGNAIAPVCQFLGTHLLGTLTHSFGLTAMQSGLGQLIGLAGLGIGSVAAVMNEKFTEWYVSQHEGKSNEIVFDVDEPENTSTHWRLGKKTNRFFHKLDKAISPSPPKANTDRPTKHASNVLFFKKNESKSSASQMEREVTFRL